MSRVMIGMDPHKRSATIEAIDEREKVLTRGRFGTDSDGYRQMLAAGRAFSDRVWAVEGCNGVGRHIAQRLLISARDLGRRRTGVSTKAGWTRPDAALDHLGQSLVAIRPPHS